MPNPYLARREQARRIEKSAGAETGRDREQPRGLGHDQAHRTALLRPEVLLLLPVAGIPPSLRLRRIVRALRPADAGRRHGSGEELRKGAAVEVGIVLREEAGDKRHRPRAGVCASEEEVLARRKGDGRPRGSTLLRCSVVFGHGCCRLRISAAANEKRVILGLFFSLSLCLFTSQSCRKIFFDFRCRFPSFYFFFGLVAFLLCDLERRRKVHGRGEKRTDRFLIYTSVFRGTAESCEISWRGATHLG